MDNPIKQLNAFEKNVGTRHSLTVAADTARRYNHMDTYAEIQESIQQHNSLVALKRAYLMGYKEGEGKGNHRKNSIVITVPITWATHYGKNYKVHPDYIEKVRKECQFVLRELAPTVKEKTKK